MTDTLTIDYVHFNPMFIYWQPFRDMINDNLTEQSDDGSTIVFTWGGSGMEYTYDISVEYKLNKNDIIKIKSITIGDAGEIATLSFDTPYNTGETTFDGDGNGIFSIMFETLKYEVLGSGEDDHHFFDSDFADVFKGRGGNDELFIQNRDKGIGGSGDDLIYGEGNRMTLSGGGDNDILFMEGNKVSLNGGKGNDFLIGEGGLDVSMKGGAGSDVFVFDVGSSISLSERASTYTIKDFEKAKDVLIFADGLPTYLGGSDFDNATKLSHLDKSTFSGFTWKQKNGNLILKVGETKVTIKDTLAKNISLDRLGFSADRADEIVYALSVGSGFAPIANSFAGRIDIVFGEEGDSNILALSEDTFFDIYSADLDSISGPR